MQKVNIGLVELVAVAVTISLNSLSKVSHEGIVSGLVHDDENKVHQVTSQADEPVFSI